MSKYLYGASVQGIQEFIFKTNKLKEIIGASEIVKSIDKIDFQKIYNLKENPEIVLQAAGNIRLVFNNIDDLKKVVKNFSKDIMLKAYGITISQAVIEHINDYKIDSKELEKRLKIQRSKVAIPLSYHFNILKQNPRTALSLVDSKNDKATNQKVEEFEIFAKEEIKRDKKTIFEIEKLSNDNNKIAIIHADGNGLGNIVKDLNKDDIIKFSKVFITPSKKTDTNKTVNVFANTKLIHCVNIFFVQPYIKAKNIIGAIRINIFNVNEVEITTNNDGIVPIAKPK